MRLFRGRNMDAHREHGGALRRNRWRIVGWSAIAGLVLAPWLAMQISDEVNWSGGDFALFGALLVGVGLAGEVMARRTGGWTYRAGLGLALATAVVLILANGAVGIIGSEDNAANLMYGGVLAVGLVGALVARFRPAGMARAMAATAAAHVVVGVVALTAGWGGASQAWPWDVAVSTGVFAALWLLSAWLFRKAA